MNKSSAPTACEAPQPPVTAAVASTETTTLVATSPTAPATASAVVSDLMKCDAPASKRTRNGKVARLPKLYRDMVNRMLRNNISHDRIVAALEEVGLKVTRRNISNWKTRGGYRDWCMAEDQAVALRLHQDNMLALLRRENATELAEVGLQFAAMRLSEFFLSPQASELLASNPQEYHRRLADLARVNAEIQRVQKYRDDCAKGVSWKNDPERKRLETEKDLEQVRDAFSGSHNPEAPAKTADTPHRNLLPKDL